MLAQRNEFRIASIHKDRLVIVNKLTSQKFLYRELNPSPWLQRFKCLSHPNLLRVHEVIEDESRVGVYYEHYCLDLSSQTRCQQLDSEAMLNTLRPIVQAIEYMHSMDVFPTSVALRNIVADEHGEVKFADDLLIGQQGQTRAGSKARQDDYWKLLQLAFLMLDGHNLDNQRAARLAIKKLKPKLEPDVYEFLNELYEKSRQTIIRIKKIRKKHAFNNQNKERSNPRDKVAKQMLVSRSSESSGESDLIPIKPLN